MSKQMQRPVIEVQAFYDGNSTIYEAFGKVYAQIFREKLREQKSAPLANASKNDKVKSS